MLSLPLASSALLTWALSQLVHSGEQLFETGYKKSLGQSLDKQLKALGVKTVYGAKVHTAGLDSGKVAKQEFALSNGSVVKGESFPFSSTFRANSLVADFLFKAYGCLPNSSLVKAFDASLVNDAGFITVKPPLQLASLDGSLDHIFAFGDYNDVAETKLVAFAKWQVRRPLPPSLSSTDDLRLGTDSHRQRRRSRSVKQGASQGSQACRTVDRRHCGTFRRRRTAVWLRDWRAFSRLHLAACADARFCVQAWLSSLLKSKKLFQSKFVDDYKTIKA